MTNQRASSARATASRRNGAKSRGPKTPEGKARSAQNALKHGLRAEKYVALPEEDAAAFAALEAALIEELAPADALQSILVGRIARAAWRLERAERLEVEVFAVRDYGGANPGLRLIRDGNGTRSIETVMRYRGAAMAELTRSLRTLKALQAAEAKSVAPTAARALTARGRQPAPPPPAIQHPRPDAPERRDQLRLACPMPDQPGHTLHEAAAPWQPNEPEPGHCPHAVPAIRRPNQRPLSATPNEPEARQGRDATTGDEYPTNGDVHGSQWRALTAGQSRAP